MRGVIGAGTDGFVYNPPHVRSPPTNRKVTRTRSGKTPRPNRSLAESVEMAEQEEEKKEEPVAQTSGEEEKKTESGKRWKEKKKTVLCSRFQTSAASVEETTLPDSLSFQEVVQQASSPCGIQEG